MGLQCGIEFLAHGRAQAVTADHHDRIEVMGRGAQVLALFGRQFECGHRPIIGAR
jgi:hypothetical protein